MSPELAPKPVSASRVEMVEMILPNDANPLGTASGGKIMHLIDIAAAKLVGLQQKRKAVFDALQFLAWQFQDVRVTARLRDGVGLRQGGGARGPGERCGKRAADEVPPASLGLAEDLTDTSGADEVLRRLEQTA